MLILPILDIPAISNKYGRCRSQLGCGSLLCPRVVLITPKLGLSSVSESEIMHLNVVLLIT